MAGRVVGSPTQELKGKVKKTVGSGTGRIRRCQGAGQGQRREDADRDARIAGRRVPSRAAAVGAPQSSGGRCAGPRRCRHRPDARGPARLAACSRWTRDPLFVTMAPHSPERPMIASIRRLGIRQPRLLGARLCRSGHRRIFQRELRAAARRPELRLLGLRRAIGDSRTATGAAIPRRRVAGQYPRDHAAAVRPAAPRRLPLRQGQCGMDPRAVQGVGVRRENRDLPGAVSDAEDARCWSC